MSYQPRYDPRHYKRASRFFASGRLRPLREVLITNQFRGLAVRWTSRRPIGWSGRWPRYARDALYRSGYQKRRRSELFAALILERGKLKSTCSSRGRQPDNA